VAGRAVIRVCAGATVIAAVALASPTAHGAIAGHRIAYRSLTRQSAIKAPAGIPGELEAVTVVPHSGDIFAIDSQGSVGNTKYVLLRRHHGHWSKVKVPNLGGRYGHLDSLTAASPSSIFLGGAVEVGHGDIQEHPTIWRFKGGKFVTVMFPATEEGDDAVASMSASSPSNAWAGGGIFGPDDNEYTAHWNGHAWTLVSFPRGACGEDNFAGVSTSSPSNAWAYEVDTGECQGGNTLLHWDGKTWTAATVDLTGIVIFAVATSGPKLAYAVGETSTGGPAIFRWNGKAWSKAKLAGGTKTDELFKVAIKGKSAWAIGENANRHAVILHTSGGKWTAQKAGSGPIFLNSISASSSKHAVAVGTVNQKTFVDYYNGHKWVPQAS
jgi:hypothetical protein